MKMNPQEKCANFCSEVFLTFKMRKVTKRRRFSLYYLCTSNILLNWHGQYDNEDVIFTDYLKYIRRIKRSISSLHLDSYPKATFSCIRNNFFYQLHIEPMC